MTRLAPWIAFLMVGTLAGGGVWMAQNAALEADATRLQSLQRESRRLNETLGQLNEDRAAAERLASRFTEAEVAHKLAPPDKDKGLAALEDRAAALALGSVTVRFGPEKAPPALDEPGLALASVTIDGQAPDDRALNAFIDDVLTTLPGRVTLTRFEVRRPSPDAPLALANLAFHLTFDWLANATNRSP
jgi:hypothetical protein